MARFTKEEQQQALLLEGKTRATMDAIAKHPLTSMEVIVAFALADLILTARGMDAPASGKLAAWAAIQSRIAIEMLLPLVDSLPPE